MSRLARIFVGLHRHRLPEARLTTLIAELTAADTLYRRRSEESTQAKRPSRQTEPQNILTSPQDVWVVGLSKSNVVGETGFESFSNKV